MWIQRDLETISQPASSGLTIGAFDGVHRGHQALISRMAASAHAQGWQAVVLTFDPLPRQVLSAGENGLLSTLEERLAQMALLDVDGVVIVPFDREVAQTPAAAFVRTLVRRLTLRELWVGPDFTLGRGAGGDIPFLREMGRRHGFTVEVFEDVVRWQGEPVRSSRIRRAIRTGNVAEAHGCLGRPYRLTGRVRTGDRRGRTLGFPTANLDIPSARLLPASGVYICHAHGPYGIFDAVTNVGARPTFEAGEPRVEAYLLGFRGDLYDAPIRLDFLHRLRPELKFPSAQALVEQIRQDVDQARAWLRAHRTSSPEVLAREATALSDTEDTTSMP